MTFFPIFDFAFQELKIDQLKDKICAVTREKEDALKEKTQILDEVLTTNTNKQTWHGGRKR